MSNKADKPVWRLNIGDGVPSDLGDRIIFDGGYSSVKSDGYGGDMCDWLWDIDFDMSDIYAYETKRTRKAKYRG